MYSPQPIDLILSALANQLRRSILLELAKGENSVYNLRQITGGSQPLVSRALATFVCLGLARKVKRDNRHVFYALGPAARVSRDKLEIAATDEESGVIEVARTLTLTL